MEEGDNILDAIYDEDNLDDDVDMIDVEEGELVELDSQNVMGQSSAGDINAASQESHSNDSKLRAKKKKKNQKRKRRGSGSKAMDINRFVLGTCRHLKEKKSYMVYTAVGCLGISALSDLIKEIYFARLLRKGESHGSTIWTSLYLSTLSSTIRPFIISDVDAIQACGGQKTADGRRFRTGGGILWSILKVREPKAYEEIMKRAREFEKQFRKPNVKQPNGPKKEDSSEGVIFSFTCKDEGNVSDSASLASKMRSQHEPATSKEKSISVHDSLRIPVSYDDDLLGEIPIKDAS